MYWTYYVIYNRKRQSFMAIDLNSGGYLYPVGLEIHTAIFFKSKFKAQEYLDGFKSPNNTYEYDNMEVREIQIKVID